MTGCIRGLKIYEAKNFPGYNKESFIEDNAERFMRLANEVFDTIGNAGFDCFDLEEKSYGIYMDLEQ